MLVLHIFNDYFSSSCKMSCYFRINVDPKTTRKSKGHVEKDSRVFIIRAAKSSPVGEIQRFQ